MIKSIVAPIIVFAALLAAGNASAQDIVDVAPPADKYPPVFFVSNVKVGDFKNKLENSQAFRKLDSDSIGLPIGLRAVYYFDDKVDGAEMTTGLLSAMTLGLTPMRTNKNLVMRYDIFVQGDSIADFKYTLGVTDVVNIWSAANQQELSVEAQAFLEGTIPQFLAELKDNEKVRKVFAEYDYYFGE